MNEDTAPRVAVLLPTYNAAAFVEKTLQALRSQDYPRLDVLISDDASSDATAGVCEAFAAANPHWQLYRQSERLGWVENLNFLLRQADADYVLLACHDDLAAASYISTLVVALERSPDAVLAYSDGVIQAYDGTRSDWSFAAIDGAETRLARARLIARQPPNWPAAFHGLVRAKAAHQVGGLRRHRGGEFGADLPWLLHLALLGEFVRVAEPLFHKICLPSGLSNSWRYGPRNELAVALSGAREIRRARPPLHERWLLYTELAGRVCRIGARSALLAVRRHA